MSRTLYPSLTLAELYPPGTIFNLRPTYQGRDFLTSDPVVRDGRTGGALTIAGGMPTLCARSVVAPWGLQLLEEAGIPCTASILPYESQRDFDATLEAVAREHRKVAFQEIHAVEERSADLYAVPRDLLVFLNNKASLPKLVPSQHVAPRELRALSELDGLVATLGHRPVVLKAATDQATAAGHAVMFARNSQDLVEARRRFDGCTSVVVEELLDVRDNYCLNFASDGHSVRYLGASRQVTDDAGAYSGNWFEPDLQLPPEAVEIGREIMHQATALGYRGIAGFDIVRDDQGRLFVIDLNFRINGSTPVLLLRPAILERYGEEQVGRLIKLVITTPLPQGIATLREAIHNNTLLPLGFMSAADSHHPADYSTVTCLVLGRDRDEVESRLRQLKQRGIRSDTPNKKAVVSVGHSPRRRITPIAA